VPSPAGQNSQKTSRKGTKNAKFEKNFPLQASAIHPRTVYRGMINNKFKNSVFTSVRTVG